MSYETVLGQPALFRLSSESDIPEDLSARERRLLVGAMNFHALMAPGRALEVHSYDGGWDSLPRTTDDTTFTGMSRAYASRLYSFAVESLVPPEEREPIRAEAVSRDMVSNAVRHIRVSRDDVLSFDPPRELSGNPVRRALREIRSRWPLMYDEARDLELLRHRRAITRRATRRRYEAEFLPGGIHDDSEIVTAPPAVPGRPRAVLIGLHWFELGGAERWAFETVRLVREAGMLPIVFSNRDSHHPWITRPELDGALLVPFSEATSRSQTSGVEEVLRALLRTFDVRGVVVHHNQWLYDRLAWIRRSRPGIPVIDSTHIIEYRGGGYPLSSVLVEDDITAHHVISPSLARWMTQVQGVAPEKVVMAPLGGLTVGVTDVTFRKRPADERLIVAFVGRMARQKAPEVFVEMAARLRDTRADVRFIMHGDGEMASWVDELIEREHLGGVLERRPSTIDVGETMREAHLLVVTSHNEGLTLTTLEAIAHGVPVVSTDVGAQSDIIPERALVGRQVHRVVRDASAKVLWLAEDEEARRRLWNDERKAEKKLLSNTSASAWFAEEIASW